MPLTNVIDVFSKKVWSVAVDDLSSKSTVISLNKIFSEAKVLPKRIITDRGAEFQLDFKNFINRKKITHIYGAPQSATTQAVVERVNRTMRNKIRNLFVKTGKFEWVKFLPDIVENYNNQIHSTTGYSPNDLWWDKNTPLTREQLSKSKDMKISDFSTKEDKIIKVAYKNRLRLEKFIKDKPVKQLNIGDYVRISLKAYNTKIRALYKGAGLDVKKINIYYTPRVYKIKSFARKGNTTTRPLYYVEHIDGSSFEPYADSGKKVFYGSELYKINSDTVEPRKIKTNDEGDIINKVFDADEKEQRKKEREALRLQRQEAKKVQEENKAKAKAIAIAKEKEDEKQQAKQKQKQKQKQKPTQREETNMYKKQFKERIRRGGLY